MYRIKTLDFVLIYLFIYFFVISRFFRFLKMILTFSIEGKEVVLLGTTWELQENYSDMA